MTQQTLCNDKPVDTKEGIMALLGDKGGARYYAEMANLPVNPQKIQAYIEKTCKSRTRTWLEICARCGMCADSCFIYQAHGNDPKQVPAYKIQSTLGELIRRKGNVDAKFMIDAMEVAWAYCTCCNRCPLFCPHGIDTGVMFSYLRGILFDSGFVPWELKIGAGMHRVYGAQMDVTTEDWVGTCEWMAEEQQEEWPGLEIPIDKEDADIMYVLNAREVKHYPEELAKAAILFHLAGENWTVPSEGWENTSLSLFAGDWAGCKLNVERVYDAMRRLRPKRTVATECGHAHRSMAIEGPYWAGLEDGQTPVPYLHYVQWVAEALRTGKLKIDPAKKIKVRCTLQDACNYVRNCGLGKYTREIVSYVVEDGYFFEMEDNNTFNYCCGGGGGLNGVGRFRKQRNIGLMPKLKQIQATGAELVISPCHNCWDAIRDMMEEFEIHDIKWTDLKHLLLDMVIRPGNT